MTMIVFNNYIGYIGGLYYTIFDYNNVVKDYTRFFDTVEKQNSVYEYLKYIEKDLKDFIAIILPENYSNIDYNSSHVIEAIKSMYSIKNQLDNGKAMTLTEGDGFKKQWISVGRYHFKGNNNRSLFVKKCEVIIKLLKNIQSKMNNIVKLNVKKKNEEENKRIRRQSEYQQVIIPEEEVVLPEEPEDEEVERTFKNSPVKLVYGRSDSFIKSTTSSRPRPSSLSTPPPSSLSTPSPPPTGGKRTRSKKRNTKKYKKKNTKKTRKYRK